MHRSLLLRKCIQDRQFLYPSLPFAAQAPFNRRLLFVLVSYSSNVIQSTSPATCPPQDVGEAVISLAMLRGLGICTGQ